MLHVAIVELVRLSVRWSICWLTITDYSEASVYLSSGSRLLYNAFNCCLTKGSQPQQRENSSSVAYTFFNNSTVYLSSQPEVRDSEQLSLFGAFSLLISIDMGSSSCWF